MPKANYGYHLSQSKLVHAKDEQEVNHVKIAVTKMLKSSNFTISFIVFDSLFYPLNETENDGKSFSVWGLHHQAPYQGLCPLDPSWGKNPQVRPLY